MLLVNGAALGHSISLPDIGKLTQLMERLELTAPNDTLQVLQKPLLIERIVNISLPKNSARDTLRSPEERI